MNKISNTSQVKESYSQVTQQIQVPTKEQAIIVDAIDGIKIEEYFVTIGNLIHPSNIRYGSRISHGRICIYLSSKEIADSLIEKNSKITVAGHVLEIRPLISKNKRIILSNVCPIISNDIILNELSKISIKPCSQITYIRAGLNQPGYTHVLSFRRQMYVNIDDIPKLPPYLAIEFDNTTYYVYLSDGKLSCYQCKEEGHLAKYCKNIEKTQQSQIENTHVQSNSNEEAKMMLEPNTLKINQSQCEDIDPSNKNSFDDKLNFTVFKAPPLKRAYPESTLTNSSNEESNITNKIPEKKEISKQNQKEEKQTIKKTKTEMSLQMSLIEENVKAAQDYFVQNNSTPSLCMDTVKKFLIDSYGNPNVLELAQIATDNISCLIETLRCVHTHASNKTFKARITRILKKLDKNQTTLSESEEERTDIIEDSAKS